jgi:hypothetical protein
MGLAGAGSKEAMAVDDVYDTFYCTYVVYSTGMSALKIDPQAPKVISIDVRSVNEGGDMWRTEKYKNNQNGSDKYYFNLNFPSDFVEEKGVSGKDPFWEHRDPESKKIYGNVLIKFVIPRINSVSGDMVFLGSDTMTYDMITYGGISWRAGEGTPDPVISFDLSDSEFIFENNQNLSISIENSGIVLGGGGSGGKGSKAGSIYGLPTEAYGGGGGGAGGGSGIVVTPEETTDGEHRGVGRGGSGWARGGGGNFILGANPLEAEKGNSGDDLGFVNLNDASPGLQFTTRFNLFALNPNGGAGATQAIAAPDSSYISSNEPGKGGNGGSVFSFKLSSQGNAIPQIEIINKGAPVGETGLINTGGLMVSGGGGGGGGMGRMGIDGSVGHVDGAPGALPGKHGNVTQGSPALTSAALTSERTLFAGGAAGFLATGVPAGSITVINESPLWAIRARGKLQTTAASATPDTYGIDLLNGTIKY